MKINKYELARKLGVSHQAVYKWFSGKSSPTLKHANKMANILNTDIETIISELNIHSNSKYGIIKENGQKKDTQIGEVGRRRK